jgi:hypothetical protein
MHAAQARRKLATAIAIENFSHFASLSAAIQPAD